MPPSPAPGGKSLPPHRRPTAPPPYLSLLFVLSLSAKKARHSGAATAARGPEAVAVACEAGPKRRVSSARSSTVSRRLRMPPPLTARPCPPARIEPASQRRTALLLGANGASRGEGVARIELRCRGLELVASAAAGKGSRRRCFSPRDGTRRQPPRASPPRRGDGSSARFSSPRRVSRGAPRQRCRRRRAELHGEAAAIPLPLRRRAAAVPLLPLCFRRRGSASEGWREALDAWAPR
jgi:hypothetical protein